MPTVLITGTSRGLGLEFARQYAADGWDVIACARALDEAHELRSLADRFPARLRLQPLDVTDFAAIDLLARRLQDVSIDVLINNAGTMGGRGGSFGASDFAEWNGVFRLNAFAPLKMAEAFVAHVARSAQKKIVAISTVMASMARNNMGGFYAYRASKAALNAIMVSLAIDLQRRHRIVAAVLHPGWVRTDMGGARAEIDPQTSVAGMRRVIGELGPPQAGRFWMHDGSELPW